MSNSLRVAVTRVAKGGACIGQEPEGRTVFVEGTIPGETVEVSVLEERKSFLKTACSSVVSASPDRVEPQCVHVAQGCGGCDWQHITADRQRILRREIVEDCLRRLAKITDVPIVSADLLPVDGYRTTVRVGIVEGKPAYRKSRSHDLLAIDSCRIAHPLIEEILIDGNFGSATEAVIRVGAATGERLVLLDKVSSGVAFPEDVLVASRKEIASGRDFYYHEEIAGKRFRIGADSFFQCRPDGAVLLSEIVGNAIEDCEGSLLDAYCGVGLFGVLCGEGRSVVGVESNTSSAKDATHNYSSLGSVSRTRFERWNPQKMGVVIADPARAGLKKAACDRIAKTEAKKVVLVSCDPASLARDAKLLADRGYGLDSVTVLDIFGQTSHVETVSTFVASS